MVAPSLAAQVGGANKASSNIDVKLLRYRQPFVDVDEYAPNDLPMRLLRHLLNFLWLYYWLNGISCGPHPGRGIDSFGSRKNGGCLFQDGNVASMSTP